MTTTHPDTLGPGSYVYFYEPGRKNKGDYGCIVTDASTLPDAFRIRVFTNPHIIYKNILKKNCLPAPPPDSPSVNLDIKRRIKFPTIPNTQE